MVPVISDKRLAQSLIFLFMNLNTQLLCGFNYIDSC